MVQAGTGIQSIVIILSACGGQSGLNTQKAGITNGRGGQSFRFIGVVRTVQILVDHICLAALGIDDGGVNFQEGESGRIVQAVINDRRNVIYRKSS